MPINSDSIVTLNVTLANANTILQGLGTLPWGQVNELVVDIRNQVQQQLKELHNSENVQSLRSGD